MSILQVEALQAGYGKKRIICDISMEIPEGQIVGILGKNGCGKTTMIKALCKGIPYEGKVSINGQDIKGMSEKGLAKLCAYVPQRSGLAIDISVLDVVLMGFYPYLGLLGQPNRKMKEAAIEVLNRAGLEKEIYSNYMELSEGQKRMCILARSLVSDAKLIIMDEPDASLDFEIKHSLMQMILERVRDKKTGILMSLHDTDLALEYCDVIKLMKDGRILHSITPKMDDVLGMEKKLRELYGNIRLLEYKNMNEKIDNNHENITRKLTMVQG